MQNYMGLLNPAYFAQNRMMPQGASYWMQYAQPPQYLNVGAGGGTGGPTTPPVNPGTPTQPTTPTPPVRPPGPAGGGDSGWGGQQNQQRQLSPWVQMMQDRHRNWRFR